MTPAVSVKTGSHTHGGSQLPKPSPARRWDSQGRHSRGGIRPLGEVGGSGLEDSSLSVSLEMWLLPAPGPRGICLTLSGCSSDPASRPRVENRWSGGLGEEWSRVTMATRKTGTLGLPLPLPSRPWRSLITVSHFLFTLISLHPHSPSCTAPLPRLSSA